MPDNANFGSLVKWDPVAGAADYVVNAVDAGGSPVPGAVVDKVVVPPEVMVGDVLPGSAPFASYSFRVKARDSGGREGAEGQKTFTLVGLPAPTNFVVVF